MTKPVADTTTIRVTRATHAILLDIAEESGLSIAMVVARAARELARKRFWVDFNAKAEALRADAEADRAMDREDAAWDGTVGDAIEGKAAQGDV